MKLAVFLLWPLLLFLCSPASLAAIIIDVVNETDQSIEMIDIRFEAEGKVWSSDVTHQSLLPEATWTYSSYDNAAYGLQSRYFLVNKYHTLDSQSSCTIHKTPQTPNQHLVAHISLPSQSGCNVPSSVLSCRYAVVWDCPRT